MGKGLSPGDIVHIEKLVAIELLCPLIQTFIRMLRVVAGSSERLQVCALSCEELSQIMTSTVIKVHLNELVYACSVDQEVVGVKN